MDAENVKALQECRNHLAYVLPMAKAWAHAKPVGSNQGLCDNAQHCLDQVDAALARHNEQTPENSHQKLRDAAEMLWTVIANVSGGDWSKQSDEWQTAAERWRDNYFNVINEQQKQGLPAENPPHTGAPGARVDSVPAVAAPEIIQPDFDSLAREPEQASADDGTPESRARRRVHARTL